MTRDIKTSSKKSHREFSLFRYGFRPFFLFASLHAAIVIPGWMALLHSVDGSRLPLSPFAWHAHEMIFGFVMAAIAGFLLTAIPSWTCRRGFAGMRLVVLVLVWLAGRLAMTLPLGLTPAVIAVVDLSFPLALIIAIMPSLVRSGNRRNMVFIVFLVLLWLANLRFHLSGMLSISTLHLAVNTILLMVTLVGGRIIPAFTSARLKQTGISISIPRHPTLDNAALITVIVVFAVDLFIPEGKTAGMVAAIAALLLALRLARWQGYRVIGDPILWVLHLGYLWLPVALGLKAASLLAGFAPGINWLHALTVGAFATMILAVMSRAALGHTGRPIIATPSVTLAYLLLTGAALARVFAPVLFPSAVLWWLSVAAVLWTSAFALFLFNYVPILCGPRIDGRAG